MVDTASARRAARLAGLLSLASMAAGVSAEVLVVAPLITPGDAAATARDLLASEQVYRIAFAANLLDYIFYLGTSVILYGLLKPSGRTVALLALAFSLAGTAIVASASVHYLAPLVWLGDAPFLAAFKSDQREALAYLSLRRRGLGGDAAMVFFGLHLFAIGWLIVRAAPLPRILGVLSALGGLCFVVNSFALFLAPEFAAGLLPYILAPGILGQAGLALWLLLMGVSEAKWRAQAA